MTLRTYKVTYRNGQFRYFQAESQADAERYARKDLAQQLAFERRQGFGRHGGPKLHAGISSVRQDDRGRGKESM